MATAENDESDIEPLVSPKNIRAINYTPNGVVLNIVKNKIEDKDYKITIKYQIQANKHYNSELIVSVSHGVFFNIKEQNAKKRRRRKRQLGTKRSYTWLLNKATQLKDAADRNPFQNPIYYGHIVRPQMYIKMLFQ
ncbi:hypothetical protein [Lentibacillus cibarius]|uniref:Uncharacterized protein n=1 Tax=Lentibacillus cibarius TaxID=2583219 RepID=A0A5S3QL74_9BACI|nr:hypothetical protein [Lentibacillus cibarius]TMN22610.1 hypothetical protein FFL34_11235 [Lentibacillus cibarius]